MLLLVGGTRLLVDAQDLVQTFRMMTHVKVGLVYDCPPLRESQGFRLRVDKKAAACALQAQMVGALYEKSLRVSSAALAERGIGSVVNLQSNDGDRPSFNFSDRLYPRTFTDSDTDREHLYQRRRSNVCTCS